MRSLPLPLPFRKRLRLAVAIVVVVTMMMMMMVILVVVVVAARGVEPLLAPCVLDVELGGSFCREIEDVSLEVFPGGRGFLRGLELHEAQVAVVVSRLLVPLLHQPHAQVAREGPEDVSNLPLPHPVRDALDVEGARVVLVRVRGAGRR